MWGKSLTLEGSTFVCRLILIAYRSIRSKMVLWRTLSSVFQASGSSPRTTSFTVLGAEGGWTRQLTNGVIRLKRTPIIPLKCSLHPKDGGKNWGAPVRQELFTDGKWSCLSELTRGVTPSWGEWERVLSRGGRVLSVCLNASELCNCDGRPWQVSLISELSHLHF